MADIEGPQPSPPLVSVIIVNWNGQGHLRECLRSIMMSTYSNIEIFVSDNSSTDESADMIRSEFPVVKTIQNKRNLGFGEGSNIAILSSRGAFVFIVNNDARIRHSCIEALLKVAISDKSIGILGCKVYLDRPDSRILEHAGGIIYPSGYTTNIGYMQNDTRQHDQMKDVDYVIGAAIMIARPVINKIGLLDSLFSLYYEETDYCYRARKAGFRVAYVPNAIVYHHHSLTVDRLFSSQEKRNLMETSRVSFVLKNFEPSAIRKWVLSEVGMLVGLVAFPKRRKSSHLVALARSYAWNLAHIPLIIRRRRSGLCYKMNHEVARVRI